VWLGGRTEGRAKNATARIENRKNHAWAIEYRSATNPKSKARKILDTNASQGRDKGKTRAGLNAVLRTGSSDAVIVLVANGRGYPIKARSIDDRRRGRIHAPMPHDQ
jgi:hypothetical protein